MKSLYEHLYNTTAIDNMQMIAEGGASGHLKHIYDYEELTLDNIKGIIYSLFNSRIEDVTEKIDGTNIQASMNAAGEVVFIRNKSDLNSTRGGMSVEDMAMKWSGNKRVQETFVEGGKILEKVFEKMGVKFFNPDSDTRVFANCECMKEGTTNVIPYVSAMVNVHDLWVYKRNNAGEWEHTDTNKEGLDEIEKALEETDAKAQLTPRLLIKSTKEGTDEMNRYFREINKIFKEAHLGNTSTIRQYKEYRYEVWVREHADWIREDMNAFWILFDRWIEGEKKTNIRSIKEMYPDHIEDLMAIDGKEPQKELQKFVMQPLDDFFARLANSVIKLCDGFINSGFEKEVVQQMKDDLDETIAKVMKEGTEEMKTKLLRQLNRLGEQEINPTEGIVFRYKGRLSKLTGSFAALNQIVNLKYQI